MEVLDNFPVQLDKDEVIKKLRLGDKGKRIESMVQELVEIALNIAKPKAVYTMSYVDNKNGNSLEIGGTKFTSRVLRANLDEVGRVFPYIATCGRELAEVTVSSGEMLKAFCLDTIKRMVLSMAVSYLSEHIKRKYALTQISRMNPGSLEDWPLTQQKELFSIFGNDNVEKLIGVRLTEACAMHPLKSVSGIYFPTEIKFESCQLCPREKCTGRRTPYDPALASKYLRETETLLRT